MFIPHRVHASIGVLAAVTVGTAAAIPASVAARVARPVAGGAGPAGLVRLEHPTGWFDAVIDVDVTGDTIRVGRSAIVSTARLLLDGTVHPHQAFPTRRAHA
jgi:4-oxalomesaconate tautomerase